jgi:hypothetical protein
LPKITYKKNELQFNYSTCMTPTNLIVWLSRGRVIPPRIAFLFAECGTTLYLCASLCVESQYHKYMFPWYILQEKFCNGYCRMYCPFPLFFQNNVYVRSILFFSLRKYPLTQSIVIDHIFIITKIQPHIIKYFFCKNTCSLVISFYNNCN